MQPPSGKSCTNPYSQSREDHVLEAHEPISSMVYSLRGDERSRTCRELSRYSLSSVDWMYKRRIAKMPVDPFPVPRMRNDVPCHKAKLP
ncbi:hypothetical protein L209DRAFT_551331 [Thermothelomyces heterothallicus CBS 203.75]